MFNVRNMLIGALLVCASGSAATFVVPSDRDLARTSDAIVWGTVLETYSQLGPSGSIQTVSTIAVEEALKGIAGESVIRVVEAGGVVDGMALILSGMPTYEPGSRVLVFLARDGEGEWTTKDLVIGKFELARTTGGEEVLIREEGEIAGWDRSGNVYAASDLRRADAFRTFVRDVARGKVPAADYYIDGSADSLAAPMRVTEEGPVAATATFAASKYLMSLTIGTLRPVRWQHNSDSLDGDAPVSPWPDMKDGVIFKVDANHLQANLGDGGVAATQAALAAWTNDCGSLVNYQYGGTATSEIRLNGTCPGGSGCDGVNGITFGDPFNEVTGTFSGSGGILGRGGSLAFNIGHSMGGEDFWSYYEGHVVINDGLQTWVGLTDSRFTELLIHEIGHTLGFRHSNGNSVGSSEGACDTAGGTNPCSSSAIMTISASGPFSAALQQWDIDAVRASYPGGTCAGVTGDVNGDGLVNEADLTAVKAAFRANPGGAGSGATDCNADGTINGRDILCVENVLRPLAGTQTSVRDIDRNGLNEPLTDGLLALRRFFGFSDGTLINGAVAAAANRTSAAAIQTYFTNMGTAFDIDGNGTVEPLTDGLLILRYSFGFTGNTLTNGAVGSGATRTTAVAIQAYLAAL